METNRKAKVIMLPTKDITPIVLHSTGLDRLYHSIESVKKAVLDIGGTCQHLYITTDEEIKEGDWFLWGKDSLIDKCTHTTDLFISTKETDYPIGASKKIISSTNEKLNLPQPSQAFIEKYCKVGGIDEVLVEYEYICHCDIGDDHHNDECKTPRLKVDSHNTITIHPIKDSWSREEVIFNLKEVSKLYNVTDFNKLNNWIKENL